MTAKKASAPTKGRRIFPPGTSVLQAVQEAVKNVQITPADTAAVQLAAEYAQAIDASVEREETLDKLGPKLLAVLDALGATPAARAKATKAAGLATKKPETNLEKLRAARRRKT